MGPQQVPKRRRLAEDSNKCCLRSHRQQTMIQKPRSDDGAGGQLSFPWQRVKAISVDGLLLGAHDRTLRNPTVHGASGEACIRHQEKPQR